MHSVGSIDGVVKFVLILARTPHDLKIKLSLSSWNLASTIVEFESWLERRFECCNGNNRLFQCNRNDFYKNQQDIESL